MRDYEWTIIPGDDEERVFEYNDANGASIDLTDYEVAGYVHSDLLSEPEEIECEIGTPATDGKVSAKLTAGQTQTIADNLGEFGARFNVRLTSPAGNKRTLVHGSVLVDGDES